MRVKPQIYLWVLVFLAMVGAGAGGMVLFKENNPSKSALPAIFFYDGKNRETTLDDFKGQVVLVNLWATWCPPCVAELPSLDRLQGKLKDKNFRVVAISIETDRKKVTKFLEAQGIENLAPYMDKEHDIQSKWTYSGIPTSFLLDKDGKLVKTYNGAYEWDKGDIFKEMTKAATP